MKTILISIHPRYCRLILSGEKTIELRKQNLNHDITKVMIYETRPKASIIASFKIKSTIIGDAYWFSKHYQKSLQLSEEEIKHYLGDRTGYGLEIYELNKLITPVPLEKMRETGINPPQNFIYLSSQQLQNLGIKA
jgi:predicted transcriptional regulator